MLTLCIDSINPLHRPNSCIGHALWAIIGIDSYPVPRVTVITHIIDLLVYIGNVTLYLFVPLDVSDTVSLILLIPYLQMLNHHNLVLSSTAFFNQVNHSMSMMLQYLYSTTVMSTLRSSGSTWIDSRLDGRAVDQLRQ